MKKKSKIILLILHIICVVFFTALTIHSFIIRDAVSGGFGIIAAGCWTGCTVFDILDLYKLYKKDKENK